MLRCTETISLPKRMLTPLRSRTQSRTSTLQPPSHPCKHSRIQMSMAIFARLMNRTSLLPSRRVDARQSRTFIAYWRTDAGETGTRRKSGYSSNWVAVSETIRGQWQSSRRVLMGRQALRYVLSREAGRTTDDGCRPALRRQYSVYRHKTR
jgi:hypothetical protein